MPELGLMEGKHINIIKFIKKVHCEIIIHLGEGFTVSVVHKKENRQ